MNDKMLNIAKITCTALGLAVTVAGAVVGDIANKKYIEKLVTEQLKK